MYIQSYVNCIFQGTIYPSCDAYLTWQIRLLLDATTQELMWFNQTKKYAFLVSGSLLCSIQRQSCLMSFC